MKTLMSFLLCISLYAIAFAQTPPVKTSITGTLNIQFPTRSNKSEGVVDKYNLNVNVSNSALFRGTIEVLPYISGTFGSQQGKLTYAVDCDVVNPNNPSQTRNVGKLYGFVPVNAQNVYDFSNNTLKVGIFGIGSAKGFESKFGGFALGKPPAANGLLTKLKRETLSFTKSVNGKSVSINVNKYDKMEFKSHVLCAGPVQIYPEVTVNGVMIYDYSRNTWLFQNVTVEYFVDGRVTRDILTGNIRWVEPSNRSTTGEGEYIFDVRINEPLTDVANVFAGPQDESAFFSEDSSIAALNGSMKYKDTIINETVTSSSIKIDLTGNKLTKQQTMYLGKLLFLSAIVPLNSE
jgi:hypothetical protein